ISSFILLCVLTLSALALLACGSSAGEGDDRRGAASNAYADDSDTGAGTGAAQEESAGNSNGAANSSSLQVSDLRKVIFESWLELGAEDVTARYHEVASIARRMGGHVADSRLTLAEAD